MSSLANAIETSVDVAVAAVLLHFDIERRTKNGPEGLRLFFGAKDVFTLLIFYLHITFTYLVTCLN